MRQRGRHARPGGRAGVRPPDEVITSLPSDADWEDARERRTLGSHTIAVGVCPNSATGHWHTWISLYGADLTTAGVYATEDAAKAQMERIRFVLKDWRGSGTSIALLNDILANGVFESLVGPAAMVLPDADVKRVLEEVSKAAERRN